MPIKCKEYAQALCTRVLARESETNFMQFLYDLTRAYLYAYCIIYVYGMYAVYKVVGESTSHIDTTMRTCNSTHAQYRSTENIVWYAKYTYIESVYMGRQVLLHRRGSRVFLVLLFSAPYL